MSGALTGLVDTTGPPSGVGELLFQSKFAHELQDLERKKVYEPVVGHWFP